MTNAKSNADTILDKVRRDLVKATAAAEILAAGEPLAALIEEIEDSISELVDQIAGEAGNLDRGPTEKLRADKGQLSEALTDVENLTKLIDDRYQAATKAETNAEMVALRTSAEQKREEVFGLVVGMEEAMRIVVDGATRFRQLHIEFEHLNIRLRAAGREDLALPPIWRGIANGESFPDMFDHLWDVQRRLAPEQVAKDFFTAVDRIRAASAMKSDNAAPPAGLLPALRSIVKRVS